MGHERDAEGSKMAKVINRRGFLSAAGGLAAGAALVSSTNSSNLAAAEGMKDMGEKRPNILFIMTDQQRADTIAAMGNAHTYTPNMDRLVRRGVAFSHGYSSCPVCVPARATIRTGREPHTTGIYQNMVPNVVEGQPANMEERCGKYLPRTLRDLGYRTFGIGKFHTAPKWDEDLGYETHLYGEEMYGTEERRERDAYAAFIKFQHPEYDFLEGLMGERTEMYYMPQMSATPAPYGVEAWAASRAVEQIGADDGRPYFGFVSFVGPHPPFAPPIPFNRMYDPDRMPNPIRGDLAVDHADEQITWMNHIIWADGINDHLARVLKARYYGEISYIDYCIGKILDAVEAREDADNTLICFYSDHGDHLGDHTAWQKESFFDAAAHVPFLVSWPGGKIPQEQVRGELVCLTDLFGIATKAAGKPEYRDGMDVLGLIAGEASPREHLFGFYGIPGTPQFKIMVRDPKWKYIYLANGDRELLFDMENDPHELKNLSSQETEVVARLRPLAEAACARPNIDRALENGRLRAF